MGIVEASMAAWQGTTMSLPDILKLTVEDWEKSPERAAMIEGGEYHRVENAITKRQMWVYDTGGNRVPDPDATNHKVAHGFMRLALEEKIAYLLGNRPTLAAVSEDLATKLQATLGAHFADKLIDYGLSAGKAGLGWLHPYIGTAGGKEALRFMVIPSEQVIPLWADDDHETLQAVVRTYFVEEYVGGEKKNVRKVEMWTPENVMYYVEIEGKYVPDIEKNESGVPIGHLFRGETRDAWGFVPMIPLKNNSDEMPDHLFVKPLIDAYDTCVSDTVNTFDDMARLIMVLVNYDGTDLAQFRENVRKYKAIKVGEGGDVKALHAELEADAAEKHLDRLRADFFRFAQSVDMSLDDLGSAPSGIALEFLYSGLKLKCDTLERKLGSSFEYIFAAVAKFLSLTNQGAHDPATCSVTFTRAQITNIKDSLDAVASAQGSGHSNETSLSISPIVTDPIAEMAKVAAEGKDSQGRDFDTGA